MTLQEARAKFLPRNRGEHLMFWSIFVLPLVAIVFDLKRDFFFTLPILYTLMYVGFRLPLHTANRVYGTIGRPLVILMKILSPIAIVVLAVFVVFDDTSWTQKFWGGSLILMLLGAFVFIKTPSSAPIHLPHVLPDDPHGKIPR